ncbi:MAG TPA: 6,7-dimethyl-8-ribityllumazine synthase [Thermodesulfobacteriota bacterium]|nr:6,7-dimethyl-8-ribityllumazine synthase [Thermodesulfobacteriota bacterium]
MPRIIEGSLSAKGLTFGVVISRFNDFIGDRLMQGAIDTLLRSGASEADIHVVKVPGSFEIPVAAQALIKNGKYDAIICLGAIIRGSTPHFDYIASEAAKGIAKLSMEAGLPIAFGIITADSIEQAIERAGTKSGNKGRDAALNAIEMANLFKELKKRK